MLVLTRKNCEGVRVDTADGPVTIHVQGTSNGRVRMVIDAPDDCPILRVESDGSITDRSRAKCKVQ